MSPIRKKRLSHLAWERKVCNQCGRISFVFSVMSYHILHLLSHNLRVRCKLAATIWQLAERHGMLIGSDARSGSLQLLDKLTLAPLPGPTSKPAEKP